jgi:glutamine synthetase
MTDSDTRLSADIEALASDCELYAEVIECINVVDDETGANQRREPKTTLLKAAAALRAQPQQSADSASEPRFFIDHGMIHDRVTGKHVTTDGQPPFEDSIEQVCELLNGLAAQPQTALSPADEAEHFIQAEIDSAPEPLRRLGEFLADVLDEDHWKAAERMLLALAVSSHQQPNPSAPDVSTPVQGLRE